ncbi:RraA family protein [Verticiella sediminum]|nr:RraA family protein [Verticiella sediminum]
MSDDDTRLLAAFEGLPTSAISDCMDRLAGTYRLAPRHGATPMLGYAHTVRVRAGDNLHIHDALQRVRPGDVLVVDGGGCEERALVGEILMRVAMSRGAAGFVIDGAVRDVAAFRAAAFPCYARGVTHRGPYKHGPGGSATAVVIDGVPVSHGDVVVGDEDGVVFVPRERAGQVAAAARAKLAAEAEILAQIDAGTYDETWIAAALMRG